VRIKSSPDRREPHETFRRCDYSGGGKGCCVRNAFISAFSPFSALFFLPSHFLFFLPFSLPAEEFVYFRGGVLRDNVRVPSLFDGITYVPFLAMCPPGKFQKSYDHSRLYRDGECSNIRFSGFPTFSSSRLYLIFHRSLSFVSLSIFL